MNKQWIVRLLVVIGLGAIALLAWRNTGGDGKELGPASGNGRIEAVDIDIATKTPGRIKDILAREGDLVTAGQVVALMDTQAVDAQLLQAEAQLQQARSSVDIARSQFNQRLAERTAALAVVTQREAELGAAQKRQGRSSTLAREGASSQQEADDDDTRVQSVSAAVNAARAQVAACEAAIATAQAQVAGAESSVVAARASVERIRSDLDDSTLKAPRTGRIQHRIAQPGEVLGSGGKVLTLIDLNEVYMSFFLPETTAGKLSMGAEARLVLDAAPQYVFPATVSFVASQAQFTPKTVETSSERQKLVFRVKAQVAPELLQRYRDRVKTGLPGVAYVRLSDDAPWPVHLQVKLPQ